MEKERLQDKKMVSDIVTREKMIGEIEAQQREKQKQDTRDFLKNFKNRSNELALNQDHIDKLLKQEMDRQWGKRQDQWDKDENARVNLLYDVYGNRAEAVQLKRTLAEQEALDKELEKRKLNQDVNEFTSIEKRKDLEEILVTIFLN